MIFEELSFTLVFMGFELVISSSVIGTFCRQLTDLDWLHIKYFVWQRVM